MKFGRKVSDPNTNTGGGGGFIKYLRDGDTTLRFLEEPTEWTEYWEHFDKNSQRSYPCTNQRDTCPGCVLKTKDEEEAERDNRQPRVWGAQKRYLVNALGSNGYVDLWKMPGSLMPSLQRYADRFGTITDREYTLSKFEANGRTQYDAERGDKDFIDLSPYRNKMADHEAALQKAWIEVFGAPPEETLEAAPAVSSKPTPTAESAADDKVSSWGAKAAEDDVPPSEPAGSAEAEQEIDTAAEREILESDLRQMSPDEIKTLIDQAGLPPIPFESDDSNELADYLIAQLGGG